MHFVRILILLLFATSAMGQTVIQQDQIIARQRLRIAGDTSKYFTSIATTINGLSTHRQAPTAKAVWDYGQTLIFNLVTTPVLSGAGTVASPLTIAQQGATAGQVLKWNGTTWAPGADNNTGIIYTGGTGISVSGSIITNTGDTNPGDDITGSGSIGYLPVFTAARTVTSGNIFDNGFIGIGTNVPTRSLHIANYTNNYLRVEGFNNVGIELVNNNLNPNATWSTYASLGTPTTPLALENGKRIGAFIYYGYDGSTYRNGGGMDFVVDGAVSVNNVPTRWDLSTKNASWGVPLTRLTVRSDGKTGVNQVDPVALLHARGLGSTSSTIALLAENSGGTDGLWVLDNATVGINGNGGAAATIVGRDVNNIITSVSIGSGLSFSSGTISNTGDTNSADDITGTGSVNTIPKFTGTRLVGNSVLTDDGNTLQYQGAGFFNRIEAFSNNSNSPSLAVKHAVWPQVANVSHSQIMLVNGTSTFGASDISVQVKNEFTGDNNMTFSFYDGAYKSYFNARLGANTTTFGWNSATHNRTNGPLSANTTSLLGGMTIQGLGSTGATNTLHAMNAGGVLNFRVRDDGVTYIRGTGATATSITGRDGSNEITNISIGSGLGFTSGTLSNTGDTNASDDITTTSSAGGELTGPFGNLAIIPNAITATKIASDAVTTVKIANDAVTSAKISDNAVGASELASTTVTAGTYNYPTLQVDQDGRITAAGSNTPPNIYNIDGSLTGARVITMGTNTLTLDCSSGTWSELLPLVIKGKADGTNYTRAINLVDASNNTKGVLSFTNTQVTLSANAGGTMVLGAGAAQWRWNELGWVTPNGNSLDPSVTTGNAGAAWYNTSEQRQKYNISTTGLSARTVANIEDDLRGSTQTYTSSFTITGTQYLAIANASAANRTVTVDQNMREGLTYTLRAENNTTNTVTIVPAVGYTLSVDGSSGSPTSYQLTAHEVVRITRFSTNITIDK